MNYESLYSFTALKMKSSKIRELMKYASMPGVISFGGGMPDPDNFPFSDVKNIINSWDEKKIISAMQYGTTTGYTPLVEKLKLRMKTKKSINIENQELIVTTGGQQGIFLLSKILTDIDDVILVEEPTFIGAVASFLSNGAKLVGIPMESDGVNTELLEKTLIDLRNQGKKVKFFYTIPTFQNPAGITMSYEKRKKVYEISKKHDLLILEDDPYSDLYFTDEEKKDFIPIKSFGNDAPIVYLGTFSKILSPGFRMGWVIADTQLIEKVGLAKQSVDACSSSFGQVVANDYLSSDAIDRYLTKMRDIYKNKKNKMVTCINNYFPKEIKSTNPDGGFFIYVDLINNISAEEVFKKTIEKKIAFVTGEPFHTNPKEGDKHIRLSFSNSNNEEIEKGIKIIGDTLKEYF
ncbi:MAG TPA: PLP-dependent aminotransferase family protein [Spirochaetota bacterium]|nr:PLP-dependent aminotransferase family protein [Spirochaetota bacterium]